MIELPFAVERTITIRAQRETVFRYFTDPERFARWWGAGSHIDPKEGGRVLIRYPDGSTASGNVLEIRAPDRIVFTFGYDSPGKPIAPGGSRVAITLAENEDGTLLSLRHEVESGALRDMHVMGWRYHLAVFAHVVALEQHQDAAAKIDRWFAAWSEKDAACRAQILGEITADQIEFRDAWGCVLGRDELNQHIGAVQMHAPATLARTGTIRHESSTALADWIATQGDQTLTRGTNVFDFTSDGRMKRVIGIREQS